MKTTLRNLIRAHGWVKLLRTLTTLLYEDESPVSPWPERMAHMAASFQAREHAMKWEADHGRSI